jgi:SSS family solute:Na+ symporter
MFPTWFTGVAFAAIAIGALVPAAVMSIAAANLFSRNIWREYVQPQMSRRREATISKLASLAVKVGALLFILLVPATDVIYFQTAGGVWMINALPALMIALYVKRLNTLSMILGWAAGIGIGTWALVQEKFITSLHDFGVGGKVYIGLAAIVVNLAVVLVGSLVAAVLGRGAPGRLDDDDYRVRRAEDVQVTGTRPPITQPAPGTGG